MRGDLHTLKRICGYASKVMAAGEVVLGIVTVVSAAVGLASLLEGWDPPSWVSGVAGGSASTAPGLCELLLILCLGLATVHIIRLLMSSITEEHSPFTESNVGRMTLLSKIYLVSSILLLILECLSGGGVSEALFYFLGTLLVSVVMYCLALVFRYGGLLQDESDHTLRYHGDNTQTGQGHGGPEDVAQPAGRARRDNEREPIQHQDREDLRDTLLHPERDMQGPGLPARGHPRIR